MGEELAWKVYLKTYDLHCPTLPQTENTIDKGFSKQKIV